MTVGRQLYYWLNHTQCQAGSCSQIESERSDQGSSSGHLHDRHPGNPGADSALEHTCAGLHSEKGSFCLTTRLSFTVFLALPWPFPLQKRQQVQEMASQLPSPSQIIASVFVGARLAMSLAPPALRLAFSKSFPCFRISLVTGVTHTHTWRSGRIHFVRRLSPKLPVSST